MKLLKSFKDPWDAVTLFENKLAEYGGSKYAVCVDSCSNALFLCMKYLKVEHECITLPAHTYASVPMQCIHAGNYINFSDEIWSGAYYIGDTDIVDSATRFTRNMYAPGSYYCVSFHHRKTLKLGRAGAILTDDKDFVDWLRVMIYDGRHCDVKYDNDILGAIGYHMYITPETAFEGLEKLKELPDKNLDTGGSHSYPDLRHQEVFKDYLK